MSLMLTSTIGQVQPRFFPQIPPSWFLAWNREKKIRFFPQTQLSLDEVFGLWRQMRLYCDVIGPTDRQIDPVVLEIKRIVIIVTVPCHRNDVSPLQTKTRP